MRGMIVGFAALVVAGPLAAQGMGGMNMDPSKDVGTAPLPTGWMRRMDPQDSTLTSKFVAMGSGYHVTSGGHAIYYNPKDQATGDYTVSVTYTQTKSMIHEAFGIFIGGSNLQDYAKQDYLYFDVRPVDGQILITHRAGLPAPHAIVAFPRGAPQPPVPGVHKEGADGSATNTLTIRVAGDSVHFIANGTEVKVYPKSALLGASTDGQVGLRVDHNCDLQIEWSGVKK
ncbi:MAG TPA: hypothetical protein VMH39_10260 [Gemmatimonadaceae bacterium]|nr:hypothetical protein [Gemmatimonadaceae bacterium]